MGYTDTFVQNGYNSMHAVKAIDDKQQLVDIGITLPGHRNLLFSAIKKLQATQGQKQPMMHHMDFDGTYEQTEQADPQLIAWLAEIGQSRYTDTFVQNGYNTMHAIKAIEDKQELIDIGIAIRGHRNTIFSAIKKLQATPGPKQPMMHHMRMMSIMSNDSI